MLTALAVIATLFVISCFVVALAPDYESEVFEIERARRETERTLRHDERAAHADWLERVSVDAPLTPDAAVRLGAHIDRLRAD